MASLPRRAGASAITVSDLRVFLGSSLALAATCLLTRGRAATEAPVANPPIGKT